MPRTSSKKATGTVSESNAGFADLLELDVLPKGLRPIDANSYSNLAIVQYLVGQLLERQGYALIGQQPAV